MTQFEPKFHYEYRTAAELQACFDYAGITPKRTAAEYAELIARGDMLPFKSDGPSDYGARYLIALLTFSWGFIKSIKRHSFPHDVEHGLGDESGTTRLKSNLEFRQRLMSDGHRVGATIAYEAVMKHSGDTTKPYGWGFMWRV